MSGRKKLCLWSCLLAACLGLGSPVLGQASSNAKSIVGHWSCEVTRPDGSVFYVVQVFNAGGTHSTVAGIFPLFDATGSWAKQGRIYVLSLYSMIVEEDGSLSGYVNVVQEYTVESKDKIFGVGDVLFLGGVDPLNPDFVVELSLGETLDCSRLPAEGLAR